MSRHPSLLHPGPHALMASLVGLKVVAHLATNLLTPYEFHRDELLYLAMGSHLRLLHLDFPPLIAVLGNLARLFGEPSLTAVRLIPGLAGAAVLWLALLIARELGGRRTALLLTGLAILVNPMFLRSANLFQPVVLDQLCWTLGFFALVKLCRSDEKRWWYLLGVAGGLGLLTKFSIAFFGFGVLVALLLTGHRKSLVGPGPWLAAALALVLGLPTLVGQLNLGFPLVAQLRDLQTAQLDRTTFVGFLGGQLLWGPSFLLALAGLVGLFQHPELRRYRLVAWAAFGALVLLAVLHGKPYYAGPIYPALYAAGAVRLERLERRSLRIRLGWAVAILMVGYGSFTLPFGLPILPPEPMARYAAATGITTAVTTNKGEVLPLPQDYGDMLGWRELARAAADVFHGLSVDDRAKTVVYGANYGESGALSLYGPALGLPPVVSMAAGFYFFGPGERPGHVLLFVGLEPEHVGDLCRSLVPARRFTQEWTVEENDVPILVCRAPKRTLQEIWARNPEMATQAETRRPTF